MRRDYGKGKDDSTVVLYIIEEGGHTWPGVTAGLAFLGVSTANISANEVMWEFFKAPSDEMTLGLPAFPIGPGTTC